MAYTWSDPETGYTAAVVPTQEKLNTVGNDLFYCKQEIESETTNRAAAISSEATTRAAADTSEATTRASADSALDTRVTVLEGTGTAQGIGTSDAPVFAGLELTAGLELDVLFGTLPTASGSYTGKLYINATLSGSGWSNVKLACCYYNGANYVWGTIAFT